MKTVSIIGSPRKGGNCDTLVKEITSKIDGEKNTYFLQDLNINYCQGCQKCQNGDCVRNDDINKIMDNLIDADLLIFSSPIYYGQITAQAKTFIDRFYQISQNPNKSLGGKKVINIYTQANPGDSFDSYINSLNMMPFGYMGMEVIDTIISRGNMGKGDSEQLKPAIDQINQIVKKL